MRRRSRAQHFVKGEDGATVIEYGLIAALIAVVVIAAVNAVGPDLDRPFATVDETPAAANR